MITVSVPLDWLLDKTIRGDWVEIDAKLADVIRKADPTELLCHVETEYLPSGEIYRHQLWYKQLWEMSVERDNKRKAGMKERVAVWAKQQRNIKRLTKSIIEMTELPPDQAEPMAHRIVLLKPQVALSAFNCTLET